jgi:lysophospholipase L1-like esterase
MDLLDKKEGLTNKSNIILFGDSMLNNTTYIDIDTNNNDNSVPGLIKQQSEANLYNYAKDGATIEDCYSQFHVLSTTPTNATIFISAGGNDIINENRNNVVDNSFVSSLFQKYSKMVLQIKDKFPNATICLLNIYKPVKPRYKRLSDSIDQWNSLIEQFAQKNGFKIIQTNKLLTTESDFIYDYEPSATGGQKIVDAILATDV